MLIRLPEITGAEAETMYRKLMSCTDEEERDLIREYAAEMDLDWEKLKTLHRRDVVALREEGVDPIDFRKKSHGPIVMYLPENVTYLAWIKVYPFYRASLEEVQELEAREFF